MSPPTARETPLDRAVGALRYRDFRLFYIALLVSALGGQLQGFANILQVYELTGSPLHLGLTGLARAIPTIALSPIGGVVADRVDRVRFTIVCQVITGLFSVALAVLTATERIDTWHIYLFIFLSGALAAINAPARSAIIPNLVPRNHLLNAIALHSTVWQASMIVGPMLGGIGIALFGYVPTYLTNGGLHIVTVVALTMMQVGPVAARPQSSPVKGILEGLEFVRYRSIILVLLATDSAATFLGSYRALLPIFAVLLGVGPAELGLMAAAPGVGSLMGAAVVMVLGDIRYKGLLVVGAILAYCGALVALATSPGLALSVLACFLLGLFDSLQATPRNGVIQLVTPDDLRGRVSSLQHMLAGGVPSLGQFWSGAVAAVLGAPLAVIVGAAACSVVEVILLAARPDLRAPDLGAASQEPRAPSPQRGLRQG